MTGKRGKIARIVALILAAIMIIFSIPLVALSSKAENGSVIAAEHRLGSWWWWPEDGFNETECEKYLSLYQESGINEIYFYAYSSLYTEANREKIHTFVQKAMAHGCRVAIMYDGWADLKDGDTSMLTEKIKDGFLAYKEEYPKDAVYGMHFDMEPSRGYVDQTFVDYFIEPLQELRDAGIWCDVDVNVNWEKRGGANLAYDGVTGLFNILAKYTDTMSLMSYRTKATNVVSCGEECLDAAIKYGCPITFGLETDNSGEDGVDFHTSNKTKLFEVIDEVFEILDGKNLQIPFGMAIHQNRSFYKLAGDVPERTTHGSIDENATTTQYSRVTADPTATTTEITYDLVETELYRRMGMDEYFDTTSNGVAFKISELSEALAADYEKNGPIDPDQGEYYEVMVMGVAMMSDNFYPCLIDSRGRDIWADKKDYPNGTVVQNFFVGFPPQIIANIRKPIDFTRTGTEGDESTKLNTLFLACDRGANSLSVRGITVKVYRNPNKVTTTATEPTQSTEPSKTFLLGDANSDAAVNMKDVLVLRKFMADLEVTIDMAAADVTQDGIVNLKDVLQLRKYIAGLIESL